MVQKLAMPKKAQRRNLRRKQTEEAGESKSHNSTSTEDNGSIASDLSGDSGLQSPGGSQSTTKSVRFANSSRSRARNPLRTNARGIPEPVLREIVTDVEAHGGLDYVLGTNTSFTDFCEARVEEGKESIYGVYKSSERDKVSNKLRSWARLPAHEYKEILLYCGVTPAGLRADQTPSEIEVPQLGSPRAFTVRPKPRRGTPISSPKARKSRPPRLGTPSTTPSASASTSTPSARASAATATEDTPNASNVRTARGGVNFTSYREPKTVLSSSDEEEIKPKLRNKMSIQRTDEIPVGKSNLSLTQALCSR